MRRPLLAAWLLSASAAGAQPALTAQQRAALERGERVVRVEQRDGSAWPAMTVLRLVLASPEEATAVFVDYDAYHDYIPNMRVSRVSRQVDARTAEVDYVIAVPIVRDEKYTARDRVAADSSGGYRVEWELVRAASTKAAVGHALFTPYAFANGSQMPATLLEYYSFVVPGSRLAGLGLIRTRAERQVLETVDAIARRVEKERTRKSAMTARVTALRAALVQQSPQR